MGRTQIPITGITITGTTAAAGMPADPDLGNAAANDGQTWLVVTNTGGTPHGLAVQLPVEVDGQPVTPRSYTIPAGAIRYIGPFDVGQYGIALRFDPDSSELTIAACRYGPSLPAVDTTGRVPFWLVGNTVIADADYPGIDLDGDVLTGDLDLVPATADGNNLTVNV